jgi:hypothetical protein
VGGIWGRLVLQCNAWNFRSVTTKAVGLETQQMLQLYCGYKGNKRPRVGKIPENVARQHTVIWLVAFTEAKLALHVSAFAMSNT